MSKCCLACGEQEQLSFTYAGEICSSHCRWCGARFRMMKKLYDQLSFSKQKVKGFETYYRDKYKPKAEDLPYGQPLPIIGIDISYS